MDLFSEEEIMQRANAQRQLMLDNEENYDQLATAEKIAYGAAQETTLTGNLFRYGEALYDSITDDVSYDTALSRVEDERQRDIFKEYPKFKGISEAKEGAAELTGRLGVAIADPVTWLFPWLKVAKAGKLAGAAAGSGFNATDAALRDQLVYGEINPINVGAATVLGGSLGALSGHLASKVRNKQPIDKRVSEAFDEVGSSPTATERVSIEAPTVQTQQAKERVGVRASTEAGQKPRVIVTALTNEEASAVEEATRRVVTVESRIAAIPEATATGTNLTMRYEPIKQLESVLADLKALQKSGVRAEDLLKKAEKRRRRLIKQAQNKGKPLPSLKEIDEQINFFRTQAESQPKKGAKGAKDYRNRLLNQVDSIQAKISSAKDNFYSGHIKSATARVDLAGNVLEDLNKNNKLTDNIIKSLIFEPTRPIIGGIGGYVSSGFIGDEDDTALMVGLIGAGAALGQYQKVIQKMNLTALDLDTAKLALGEAAQQNVNTAVKFHSAGTVATKSDALGGWNKVLSNLIFQKPGGATNSVETIFLNDSAEYVGNMAKMYGDSFENQKVVKTVTEVLRGWRGIDEIEEGYAGISGLFKNNGLTAEDVSEVKRIVPLVAQANNKLKGTMREAGIKFTDIDDYGLAQLWDFNFIRKGGEEAFLKDVRTALEIQAKNKVSAGLRKTMPTDDAIDNAASRFVDNIRGVPRAQGAKNTYESLSIFGPDGRFRPLASNFEKHRVLTDVEATAFMAEKGWLNLDSTAISMQYADRAIKMRSWANTIGANGELFNRALGDTTRAFKNATGDSAKFEATYIKNLKGMAEIFWGVHGAVPNSNSMGVTGMALVTTLANTTMLTRVSISAIGDLIQPIQNSGVMPAIKSIMSRVQPGESFSSKSGFKYDKSFEREYSAMMAHGTDPFHSFQSALDTWNRKFFNFVQLPRITRVARGFAYDVGVRRAFDLSKEVAGKGNKISSSVQKEMSELGIQSLDELKMLSKYEDVTKAFDAEDAQKVLNMAGRRAADRDAIVPMYGNRLFFTQSGNPYIKSLGQFLSWSQAKTAQMNALVERVESGDGALAVRALGLGSVYMGVQSLREWASPYERRASEAHEALSTKHLKESLKLSGNILPWHVDKLVGALGSPSNRLISSNISPSLSYADGFLDSLTRSYNNIKKGDFEGAAKNVAEKLPFGREVIGYSKRITGSPILEDRPDYKKGGEVLDVPNAPSEPDQRIDKMTGRPYDQQAGAAFTDQEDRQDPLQRMGFGSGGSVQDPLQRMGFGAGSLVTRLGTKALRLFDDEVVEELPLKNTDELIEEGNKLSKALQDGEEALSYVVEKSGDDLDAALKANSASKTTQRANTVGTATKASSYLDSLGVKGRSLDYGAGKGLNAKANKIDDTFEPFPEQEFNPTFMSPSEIPKNKYGKIISTNVINVLPPALREEAVLNIGNALKVGGKALIQTWDAGAAKAGMASKKATIVKEEPLAFTTSTGSYQKGFTKEELSKYVTDVLGDSFEVSTVPNKQGISGVSVVISKIKNESSVSETSPAFFGFGKKPKVEKAEEAPVPKSLDEVSDDLAINTEGKSLQEATRYVGIKGLEEGKEDYKIIADKVADQLDALEAKGFSFDYKIAQRDKDGRYFGPFDISRGGAAGLTEWKDKKNVVTINDLHPRDSLANGLNNKIILHESIHAATLAAIKVGRLKSQEGTKLNKDVVDLYKLFNYTIDNFNKKAKDPNSLEEFESKIFKRMNNSMENPAEMVAWGLTDKDMQKYLESIPYKNTNAWTAFVQKIRDILGLSPKQDTVLSEILRVSDEILSADVGQVSSVVDDMVRKKNYKGGKVLNSLRSKLNNV
jgi:hypothetical protein